MAPDGLGTRDGAGALTSRVASLLADGVTPEDLAAVRQSVGLEAGPDVVVSALERRGARLPGISDAAGPDAVGRPGDRDGPDASADPGTGGDGLLAAGALPSRLRQAWEQGGPLWLHHRGLALTEVPHVAVVGTRRATLDGMTIAEQLGHDLARAGIVVVSGMARGIDQAAHRGALRAGGATVAVLGTGLDVDYPSGSAALRDAVAAHGCLVSEYAPDRGIRYRPQFIARNRVLVGLCDAVVVVEAGARSGALNSATWATQFNRDVMVVPFSPSNRMACGSLELLCDGAIPVRDARDVIAGLDHALAGADDPPPAPARRVPAAPPGAGALMLPLLGPTPSSPSALAAATDLTPREVLIGLSELEEAGLAIRTAAGVIRAR